MEGTKEVICLAGQLWFFNRVLHEAKSNNGTERGILGRWPGYVNFTKVILMVVIQRKSNY